MAKQSAGILVFRFKHNKPEFFLVHPGGPFWVKKDAASWSIPKGEFEADEPAPDAAKREFYEETGISIEGDLMALTPVKQKSGKTVYAFALEKDIDAGIIRSNSFIMEWPPKSGKQASFPEIDKAGWFDLATAKEKINAYQVPLLDELAATLQL